MCSKNYFKKLASVGLTFLLGFLAVNKTQTVISHDKTQELFIIENKGIKSIHQGSLLEQLRVKPCKQPHETEEGFGYTTHTPYQLSKVFIEKTSKTLPFGTKPLQITYKPIAKYTEQARENCIEGKVYLKITFFANGKVGKFKVVKGLNYGLTEQAIAAAKQIRFEPAIKNNKVITVSKTLAFNFTIY